MPSRNGPQAKAFRLKRGWDQIASEAPPLRFGGHSTRFRQCPWVGPDFVANNLSDLSGGKLLRQTILSGYGRTSSPSKCGASSKETRMRQMPTHLQARTLRRCDSRRL